MELYLIRPISAQNLSDVVRLVHQVAQKRWSVAYYQKKYETPWAGGQYHGFLAYERSTGKAVAVAAALPMLGVLPNGQRIRLTQMIETFTLSEHRGKGLMTHLANKILEAQQVDGVQMFFGLLNQNNVHGFVRKLGFTATETMQYFEVKVRTVPLEALCRRLRIPAIFRWWAGLVLREYRAEHATVLTNSLLAEGFGGVLHDVNFFSYKSFTFNYLCHFNGLDAWLKLESGLLVGDVCIPPETSAEQWEAWQRSLKHLAHRAGLRKIIFQASPDTELGRRLAMQYEGRPSWWVCCKTTDPSLEKLLPQMRFGYGDFETF